MKTTDARTKDAAVRSVKTRNIAARNARQRTKETSAELPANADIQAVLSFLKLLKQKGFVQY
jgi:hypothetical protein